MQLLAEHAPGSPFDAGTPATAPPEVADLLTGMFPDVPGHACAIAARTVAADVDLVSRHT